jgi:uncharacterized protein
MFIRSITVFIDPTPANLSLAGRFNQAAQKAFSEAGFKVQTSRLATLPFPILTPASGLPSLARSIESAASAEGFAYVALGPASPDDLSAYAAIPEALAATNNVFFTGHLTTSNRRVSLPAVRACAEVIFQAAPITPDGFANLRFAALANVPAGAPFFPAAYHAGDHPVFALALESADLAVTAFSNRTPGLDLAGARQAYVTEVETLARRLEAVADSLEQGFGIQFGGLDFTLAPFPEPARSTGAAMEAVGAPAVGLSGSLAAAAILAETIDRAHFKRTGFNGLMLPVLEDAILAQRAAEGNLTLNDLLLYSTVCGTGLDCIPLPGNTSVAQLQAVLVDVAALALRHAKPLTARLMPIPGKTAGDPTSFDFGYFANSRIMSLPARPLTGFLAGDELIEIKRRA